MAASKKMSIDSKPKPSHRDESEDSAGSTPEGEQNSLAPVTSNTSQEPVQPKRKGGRKPVSLSRSQSISHPPVLIQCRSMPPLRSASRETDRLRLPSVRGAQSTSSNSKRLSKSTRPTCTTSRLLTAMLPMNASCFGIRIHFLSASCSKRALMFMPNYRLRLVAQRLALPTSPKTWSSPLLFTDPS